MSRPKKILIADDELTSAGLLEHALTEQGYEVQRAYNATQCLKQVHAWAPDLILLDIARPNLDGIATYRCLKQNSATTSIPVIFISACANKKQRIKGLELEAVDYITKPIDLAETIARVRTQLYLHHMYEQNLELQLCLEKSRHKATIGAVTQGIAHSLNNLLGVILGYTELLQACPEDAQRVKRIATIMNNAAKRIAHIVKQLNSMASLEPPIQKPTDIHSLVFQACQVFEQNIQMPAEFIIQQDITPGTQVLTHLKTIQEALQHLFTNAWESYDPSYTGPRKIWVHTQMLHDSQTHPNAIAITVRDAGQGICAEVKETLFEPFVSTKAQVGRGLGLTLVQQNLHHHHGEISIQPYAAGGTIATIRLPYASST